MTETKNYVWIGSKVGFIFIGRIFFSFSYFMNKILISIAIVILTISWVWAYLYINYTPSSNDIIEKVLPIKIDKQTKISLNTEKIDADNYETVNEFLSLLDTNTGSMNFDIQKEDFYIAHATPHGEISFIRIGSGELKEDFKMLSWVRKNAIIEDIFSAYKEQSLFPEKTKDRDDGIYMTREENLPKKLQFHNQIINLDTKETFNMIRNALENKENKTHEDIGSLAYMYDYQWNYAKADALRQYLTGSIEMATVKIYGLVTDTKGNAISWATIEILNNPIFFGKTDAEGKYEFSIQYAPYSRIRLRAREVSHSDWFEALSIFDPLYDQREKKDFILQTPDSIVDIDLDKDGKDGKFQIQTAQTTYTIPEDALVNTDKTVTSKRKFRAYVYEFTKNMNVTNFLNNDTFNESYGYVGNSMITSGMPYMQIFDLEWNEVQIRKTHPAILKNQIRHMYDLQESTEGIFEKVSPQDMQYLVDESKKWDFPITYEWIIQNNFQRWPAWWMLNRKKWIWENVGHRVIDTKWVVETIYYTID